MVKWYNRLSAFMLVMFRNDNFRSILIVRDIQAEGYLSKLEKFVNSMMYSREYCLTINRHNCIIILTRLTRLCLLKKQKMNYIEKNSKKLVIVLNFY